MCLSPRSVDDSCGAHLRLKCCSVALDDPLWPETLDQLPHDIYHLPQYLRIEGNRTKSKPEAFLAVDDDRLFFLPYLLRNCPDFSQQDGGHTPASDVISPYGYCGYLLSPPASRSSTFLAAALHQLTEQWRAQGICCAFLRLHPLLNQVDGSLDPTRVFVAATETVSVDLTLCEAEIWSQTDRKHRSTINRCTRVGFTSRIVPYQEYQAEFIEIYEETMRRVSAEPLYFFDADYFDELTILGDSLHLWIVELRDEVAAACLFFTCGGIVQAHLGGTRSEYLNLSPFSLLLHEARLWARAQGYHTLHLGGGRGGAQDSLYHFKAGFSDRRHQFGTLRMIIDEPTYTRLVTCRARAMGITPESLLANGFFPPYRLAEV